MLTPQELYEIKEYVLRELPRVLEQDPRFATFIEGILSEKFPTRDEFARLLNEMREFREESRKHFEITENRFEQVDQRFEQVDQRFEQVDQRFEQVDQRFEQVDQRFEQVDQRFEQVNQRFEQVDQRFEQVDQRFEQVDQRFKQADQCMNGLQQEMRELRTDLSQQMSDLRTELVQRMDGLQNWVEMITGGFQDRAGRSLEEVVAGAFAFGLKRPDVKPEHIRLRQKIYDPDGLVFKAGKQKEVDIIALNGELLLFEVKSGSKLDDMDSFADKVELIRLQNPDKRVSGVFISLGIRDDARRLGERLGILVLPLKKNAKRKKKASGSQEP